MVVSPTYDQSRLIFERVEALVMNLGPIRRMSKVVRTPYPRISIGKAVISARTADDDGRNLRGHAADRVVVDEAAYVAESVISEVVGPMLADVDGDLVLVSTPRGKNHFYRAWLAADVRIHGPSTANPHISAEYVERQRDQLSVSRFCQEYLAGFEEDERQVFSEDSINEALSYDCSGAECWHPRVAGVDWARYEDYTAVVVAAGIPGRTVALYVERFQESSWRRSVQRVVEVMSGWRVQNCFMDKTGLGDPLEETLREVIVEQGREIMVSGVVFTNPVKRELVERLASAVDHRRIGIPADPVLLEELRGYRATGGSTEVTRFGGVGCHDDTVTALMLAEKGVRELSDGQEIGVGKRGEWEVW